ncbi:MAG: hypothetical protein AB4426_13965 [Xenococcaceae cyanobacterium]
MVTGNGEQGTGNRERGMGNREQGKVNLTTGGTNQTLTVVTSANGNTAWLRTKHPVGVEVKSHAFKSQK